MIYGLAERLQEQRRLRNMSQREVAEILGLSTSVVSNYESGNRSPSIEVLVAMARLYGCSTDYLLGFIRSDSTVRANMLDEKQRLLLQEFLLSLKGTG